MQSADLVVDAFHHGAGDGDLEVAQDVLGVFEQGWSQASECAHAAGHGFEDAVLQMRGTCPRAAALPERAHFFLQVRPS